MDSFGQWKEKEIKEARCLQKIRRKVFSFSTLSYIQLSSFFVLLFLPLNLLMAQPYSAIK
jgi:hypothetical protein